MSADRTRLQAVLAIAREEAAKVIIGQEGVLDMALVAIFTGNHVLVEGVPGVAKTLLVRTLARILGADFNRIQFTPDLMPADITGTSVFNMKTSEFSLVKGPVFTTFLLADEINRAPAKTQAALLQAMQERKVTIDRTTHDLSPLFTVFATQNPVEFEGTYPLPEAQKDRFMLKVTMSEPEQENELKLAERMLGQDSPEEVLARGEVRQVIKPEHLTVLRNDLREIRITESLLAYMVEVVRSTRAHEGVLVGASPRATQAMVLSGRALAALSGRDFVTPDDVKFLAPAVLEHRIVLRPEYEIEGLHCADVVAAVLEEVTVPR